MRLEILSNEGRSKVGALGSKSIVAYVYGSSSAGRHREGEEEDETAGA
jgi:hypothetical protein